MNCFRALLVVLLCGTAATAADWPQWLGPKRDGGTSEAVEPWKDAPKELWKARVGVGQVVQHAQAGHVVEAAQSEARQVE